MINQSGQMTEALIVWQIMGIIIAAIVLPLLPAYIAKEKGRSFSVYYSLNFLGILLGNFMLFGMDYFDDDFSKFLPIIVIPLALFVFILDGKVMLGSDNSVEEGSCPNCGAKTLEADRYCHQCGYQIKRITPAEPPQKPPQ